MADDHRSARKKIGDRRSLSQIYLWISAAYLLILGVGSLVINPSFAAGDAASVKNLFGVLETNGWHGLAGLLLGLAALPFAISAPWRRRGAALIGALLLLSGGLLLVYGDGGVALGLIPVDTTDAVLLHVVPGVVGLVCAALTAQRVVNS